jgi:PAS domain S-box-containing protein
VIVFDAAGTCAFVTPAAAAALTVEPAQARGRTAAQLGLPAHLAREVARSLARAITLPRRGEVRLGPTGGFDYELAAAPAGGEVALRLSDAATRTRAGTAEAENAELRARLGSRAHGQLDAAEAAGATAPSRYTHLVADSPDPTAVVDRDAVVRRVNAAYCRLRARAPGELVDRPLAAALGEAAFQEVRPELERAFRGQTTRHERWFELFGVGRRCLELTYQPLYDGREVTHVALVLRDVTDQRAARDQCELVVRELELERARLQATIEQLPVGVVVADAPSGRVVAANNAAAEIFGRPVRRGSRLEQYAELRGFHPDGRPYEPHEWPLARALLAGEQVAQEELAILRANGECATISVSAAPLRDRQGQITGAVAVDVDVTARIQEQRRHGPAGAP